MKKKIKKHTRCVYNGCHNTIYSLKRKIPVLIYIARALPNKKRILREVRRKKTLLALPRRSP